MSEARLTCEQAVERLWAYIDGELPTDEADAVKEHLDLCGACYPHFDFQKAFCQFLRSRPQAGAPAELRRNIFLRLLAEERKEEGS